MSENADQSGAAGPILAIGLMSGTSLDGVDAALLRSDGRSIVEPIGFFTQAYAGPLRQEIRAILGQRPSLETDRVGRAIAEAHAEAVAGLLRRCDVSPEVVGVAGFHGQTILHEPRRGRPGEGLTVQIGDASWLARAIGIDVVFDLRGADVAAGGEGAPLAPVFHVALVSMLAEAGHLDGDDFPLAVLNLGGVGNLTWISGPGAEDLLAFDTGPANALVDDWCLARTGRAVDADGALAARGTVRDDMLSGLMEHPYFRVTPPKSLDRNAFDVTRLAGLSAEDGAATLTAFTASSVAAAIPYCPARPKRWFVCGGGRHNPTMLGAIRNAVGAPTDPVEALGWDGDALEAHAFAYLALRSRLGLPLSFPGTTGVPMPLTGGTLYRASA